jgi:hypothetical protein
MYVMEHIYIGKEYSEKHEMNPQEKEVVDSYYLPLPTLGVFGETCMKDILAGVSIAELHKLIGDEVVTYNYLCQLKIGEYEPRTELRCAILSAVGMMAQAPNQNTILREKLADILPRTTPLALSKALKVGLKTIYKAMNGVDLKPTIANKILLALEK